MSIYNGCCSDMSESVLRDMALKTESGIEPSAISRMEKAGFGMQMMLISV